MQNCENFYAFMLPLPISVPPPPPKNKTEKSRTILKYNQNNWMKNLELLYLSSWLIEHCQPKQKKQYQKFCWNNPTN